MILALLLGGVLWAAAPDQVRAQVDWQAHPAMHLAWPMYGPGLRDRDPYLTWRHQFRQQMHAPYVAASGVRLVLAAAMAAERARNPTQARRLVLRQLAWVEAFVQEEPERFALARSPEEARRLLVETDKTVIVHSIEGGRELLWQPGDAAFWAEQGVALVTLVHLRDDELGAAAINPGPLGSLVNPAGARKARRGLARGLTERGQQAISELGEAGILVDLTHMAPQAVDQALALTGQLGMSPVVTHGKLASLTRDERAFSDDQVVEIYRQGGAFNLILNGEALDPREPVRPVPEGHCPGTLDSFQLHHDAVVDLLEARAGEIFGQPPDQPLTDDQRTALATGWASDWNGWTHHSRPKHGPGRCQPTPGEPLDIDLLGLAHPGLLPQHWQRLEEQGLDLDPMLRSAELFLRMWERARASTPP